MNRVLISFLIAAAPGFSVSAFAGAGKVYFVSPADGATVGTNLKLVFGVEGKKVRPAGENVDEQSSGHHHLLLDTGPIPSGQVIPADATHVHFGKGQVETEVKLTPGKHRLTLQFADGAHRSYGPALSSTIEVLVK